MKKPLKIKSIEREPVDPVLEALARSLRKELEESVRYVPKIQIDREYHGD